LPHLLEPRRAERERQGCGENTRRRGSRQGADVPVCDDAGRMGLFDVYYLTARTLIAIVGFGACVMLVLIGKRDFFAVP